MKKVPSFSASADIARRAGVISSSYRTKDGRFIISQHALESMRLKMTPEEYVNGLDVIAITDTEAKRLIRENNYAIGEAYVAAAQQDGEAAAAEGTETTGEETNEE